MAVLVQLSGEDAGLRIAVAREPVVLGPAPAGAGGAREPTGSGGHAVVECSAHGFSVRDLGAAGGVRVNGARVAEFLLVHGDVLSIGAREFRFETEPPSAADGERAAG